jgi:3',5'-cyclic AMP phosphodiesterase CpdA
MAADHAGGIGATGPAGPDDFPFVRRRGPAALVGLTTAIPSPPGMAYGELGRRQLDRLDRILQELRADGLFRIVLLHHPPIDASTAPRKRLLDAAAFRQVIATAGAELVLHGHNHRFEQGGIASGSNTVPVFGVPSASAVRGEADRIGRYHVYRISRDGNGWTVATEARLFDAVENRFTPVSLPAVRLRRDRGTFALPPGLPPAVATA